MNNRRSLYTYFIYILSITAACKMIWGHRVVMLQYRFSPLLLSQFLFGSHSTDPIRDWSVDSGRLRTTENSRLALAKEALTSLIPRLRPDDRFGLATFTNEGRVIQPLVPVAELRHEEFLCERLAFCISYSFPSIFHHSPCQIPKFKSSSWAPVSMM